MKDFFQLFMKNYLKYNCLEKMEKKSKALTCGVRVT